jgi:putative ATP-dependent endonuclease of OLD family
MTLLEEPEAHLHPHAVTALISTIEGLPGQRIVASHSTTLVAEVAPMSIRILRRTPLGIEVSSLPPASLKRMEQFRRFFGRPYGETFFARLVVFGDGVAERDALPILVSMAIGVDPVGLGVTFVACSPMNDHLRVNPIIDALHSLRIPWLCFADNDPAGVMALMNLADPATGKALSLDHPAVVAIKGTKQIEQLLIDAGFGKEISEVASECGQSAADDEGRLRFLISNKGWAAQAVALKAKEAGRKAPPQLDPLIQAICRVLGRPEPVASGVA